MSLKAQLNAAKAHIQNEEYDQARAILDTLDHPAALKLRNYIDRVAPPPQAPPSRLTPAALVLTVLLWVGVLLMSGWLVVRGNDIINAAKGRGDVAASVDESRSPCGREWWRQLDGTLALMTSFSPFRLVVFPSPTASEVVPDAFMQDQTRRSLQARIDTLQSLSTPACVSGADEHLISALEAAQGVIDRFNVNNPGPAFAGMGRMANEAVAAAQIIEAANVPLRGADRHALQTLTDANCNAWHWTMRHLYLENQFMLMQYTISQVIQSNNWQRDLQSYRYDLATQYFKLRDAPTPICLNVAKSHLLEAINALERLLDAARGNDGYGIEIHAASYQTAMQAFYAELTELELDVWQFGARWRYE